MADPTPAEVLRRAIDRAEADGWNGPGLGGYLVDCLELYGFGVVDLRHGEADELDAALRDYLVHLRPLSGAHGQSMEASMAYRADRRLRSAAARHLNRKLAHAKARDAQ